MVSLPPASAPPLVQPTKNVYTPSQFESVKSAFKHYLFRIIPADLKPVFLLLHDKEDNAYHSADTRGRVLVRDDLIETEVYDLRRKCTNDGTTAGNHSVKIEPAANSIVSISLLSIINGDAAARAASATLQTAGDVLMGYFAFVASLAAGAFIVYPRGAGGTNYFDTQKPFNFTDAFQIVLGVDALAISEDSSYFIQYSFIGAAPTITETGPAGSAFTDVS